MYAHKKLLIAVILLSVFMTFFSLTTYLTNVAQRSHAMSRDEILKLNQQLKDQAMQRGQKKVPGAKIPSPTLKKSTLPLDVSLSADKTAVVAGKNSAKIDKAVITLSYKNNTVENITGAKLLVTVGNEKSNKFEYGVFETPTIKANASGNATFEMYLPERGEGKVQAELITPQGKKVLTNTVTITAK